MIAAYPFYKIDLHFRDNDYSATTGYSFTVANQNRLGLQVPDERKKEYGLTHEQNIPYYVRADPGFFYCIQTILPVKPNSDVNSINHLLNANRVNVHKSTGGLEKGTGKYQVYKCARILRSFMGTKIDTCDKQPGEKPLLAIDFIYESKTEKVEVYRKFIMYKGKAYTASGDTGIIETMLFVASF